MKVCISSTTVLLIKEKMQTRDQCWRFQRFSENHPYSDAFKQITSENQNTAAIKPDLMSSSKRSRAISAGRTLLSIPELRQLIPARALLRTHRRQEAAAFHIPKQKPTSDRWDKEEIFLLWIHYCVITADFVYFLLNATPDTKAA